MSKTEQPPGVGEVAFSIGPVDFFKATRTRPLRPDLPIIRNWSHVKSHAVLLGIPVGIFFYFTVAWSFQGMALSVAILLLEFLLGEAQKASTWSPCEHSIGFHDIREKPWYFTSTLLLTIGLLVVYLGPPGPP